MKDSMIGIILFFGLGLTSALAVFSYRSATDRADAQKAATRKATEPMECMELLDQVSKQRDHAIAGWTSCVDVLKEDRAWLLQCAKDKTGRIP